MENKAIALFREIDSYLDGERYYSKSEIEENENNFVLAIINKDREYLKEYYSMIEEEHIQKIESLLAF